MSRLNVFIWKLSLPLHISWNWDWLRLHYFIIIWFSSICTSLLMNRVSIMIRVNFRINFAFILNVLYCFIVVFVVYVILSRWRRILLLLLIYYVWNFCRLYSLLRLNRFNSSFILLISIIFLLSQQLTSFRFFVIVSSNLYIKLLK